MHLPRPCHLSYFRTQLQHRTTPRISSVVFVTSLIIWIWLWHRLPLRHSGLSAENSTPFVRKYIELSRGSGGRWYIPDEWLSLDDRFLQPYPDVEHYMDIRNPRTPAEAAQMALELCMRRGLYLENTKIPLIVHQTWKNTHSESWHQLARDGVETWLQVATGHTSTGLDKMAYIFWDDEAVDELIELYERELSSLFRQLPHAVEKADIFRVAVTKWFGGVYADIDAIPLKHPLNWVKSSDLKKWSDAGTGQEFYLYEPMVKSYQAPPSSPVRPKPAPDSPSDNTPASYRSFMSLYAPKSIDVGAIFGIEADTPKDTDDFWRYGYSYSVQLTNWAFAMAPHHPIASHFLGQVIDDIRANFSRLDRVDPLLLTGPPALTATVKAWTEYENPNFVWESVTGLQDDPGGRGKVVAGDILILPITGFSPGRGAFHNMGSEPFDHPNARLAHVAQGSWRHKSLRVELGKMCRTFLGSCREWSRVP